jgi:hypothetical protein
MAEVETDSFTLMPRVVHQIDDQEDDRFGQ